MNRAEMIDAAMYADAMAAAWTAKAKRIRADLTQQARDEFEKDGVAPSWRTGTATVPLALSSDVYRVTNHKAWLDWVHRNRPAAGLHRGGGFRRRNRCPTQVAVQDPPEKPRVHDLLGRRKQVADIAEGCGDDRVALGDA